MGLLRLWSWPCPQAPALDFFTLLSSTCPRLVSWGAQVAGWPPSTFYLACPRLWVWCSAMYAYGRPRLFNGPCLLCLPSTLHHLTCLPALDFLPGTYSPSTFCLAPARPRLLPLAPARPRLFICPSLLSTFYLAPTRPRLLPLAPARPRLFICPSLLSTYWPSCYG
jgi:hypothetical protein